MTEPYLAIQVVMMPRDVNPNGTIFGGVILSYIDQAGAIGARREVVREGGPPPTLVTVAMNRVEFKRPVLVGDVVRFWTRRVRIGRTSITVQVSVEAERAGGVARHRGGGGLRRRRSRRAGAQAAASAWMSLRGPAAGEARPGAARFCPPDHFPLFGPHFPERIEARQPRLAVRQVFAEQEKRLLVVSEVEGTQRRPVAGIIDQRFRPAQPFAAFVGGDPHRSPLDQP